MTQLRLKEIRRLPTEWGERVTFFPDTGFMHHNTGTEPERQGQTNRRKNPVLMRFSRSGNVFHEKMTFDLRFGHACCIHPYIVGNGTGREAGVSR